MKLSTLKKGFTLIELLIVITIIGILAVALLPSVLGAPARARDAARQADLNNIVAALETYNSDNGSYPVAAAWTCINAVNFPTLQKYFQAGRIPADPGNKPVGAGICAAAGEYAYIRLPAAANPQSYVIAAFNEGTAGGNNVTDLVNIDGEPAAAVAPLTPAASTSSPPVRVFYSIN